MGFAAVGTYREQGLLDGRWVDVLIMERLLEQTAEKGPSAAMSACAKRPYRSPPSSTSTQP
jgi:hypothetical protein